MKRLKYIFLCLVTFILLFNSSVFAAPPPPDGPGIIITIGETHYLDVSKNSKKELRERAKKGEIFLLMEGITSGNANPEYGILRTENDYVADISLLVSYYMTIGGLAYYSQSDLWDVDASMEVLEDTFINRYNELIISYVVSPGFRKAFDGLTFPPDELSQNFLKNFKSNVSSYISSRTIRAMNIQTEPDAILKNLLTLEFVIKNILIKMINDPTYENDYIKEVPGIAPPSDYKRLIRYFLSDNIDIEAFVKTYDRLKETITIGWRNKIMFHYIKSFLSEPISKTKPVYIVVGNNHLEELNNFLKLNFNDSFKINPKEVADKNKAENISVDINKYEESTNDELTRDAIERFLTKNFASDAEITERMKETKSTEELLKLSLFAFAKAQADDSIEPEKKQKIELSFISLFLQPNTAKILDRISYSDITTNDFLFTDTKKIIESAKTFADALDKVYEVKADKIAESPKYDLTDPEVLKELRRNNPDFDKAYDIFKVDSRSVFDAGKK